MSLGFRVRVIGGPVQKTAPNGRQGVRRRTTETPTLKKSADAAPKASAPKARGLEQQLEDLETLSKAAESVAKTHGIHAAYEAHERAAQVIRSGGSLDDALAALRV